MKIPLINNDEAELSVIWSIIIDNLCLQDLEITENDFFNTKLKVIFKCILQLKKEMQPIDLITLQDKLDKIWQLQNIWWISFLVDITSDTPTSANFIAYQEIVKNYSLKYRINKLLNQSQNVVNDWMSNLNEAITHIYKWLAEIESWITTNDKNIFELLEETHQYIDDIKTKDLIWYSFGKQFEFLDTISWGIERGKIYRIGWWSNVWKSWLMYNFLINLLNNTDKITFFALENTDEFTMKNLLCHKKWVNPRNDLIKKNNYDFSDEYNYFMSKENFVVTSKYRNLFDIFRIATRNKSEFIFIDFIQLVEIPWNFKWETEKYNFYSKELQKFANKYNIWVIDLSQLSNDTQRSWIDWNWSTEFKWWWSLKESCDVWIHLFKNKKREELREASILAGNKDEFNKSYIDLLISKNRLWPWAWSSHLFELDFNKWWVYLKDLFDNN